LSLSKPQSQSAPIHVTGYGCVTPLGNDVESLWQALCRNENRVRLVPEWQSITGLGSKVAAMVDDFDGKALLPRVKRRTMSKMSEMVCIAATEALQQARLELNQFAEQGRVAIIVGTTSGSPTAFAEAHKSFHESNSVFGQMSTTVFKCMSSSLAVNLGLYLDFQGPLLSLSAACSTSSQAVVLGTELIRAGLYDIVIAGGAEECHATTCLTFDVAQAASRAFNNEPTKASRPFDRLRDGIVVSEGASVVILETEESAQRRDVRSRGKVLGGAYYSDTQQLVQPSPASIYKTMDLALARSGVDKKQIDYINAHATSTPMGDLGEAKAVYDLFGCVPISSIKGHLGHSFAACGTTEIIACLKMLDHQLMLGTRNLEEIDPEMPSLDFIRDHRQTNLDFVLTNNFAFGGMNTAIVLSKA
jgi:3-oxoacyl-[acyl-carrier-protein] synthase II